MTGNIAFLGFALAEIPGFNVAPHVTALAGFIVGATVSGRIGKYYVTRSGRSWLFIVTCFEGGLLWPAALLVIGYRDTHQPVGSRLLITIGFVAIAMGFCNATIRQLKVNDLTTTVLTIGDRRSLKPVSCPIGTSRACAHRRSRHTSGW